MLLSGPLNNPQCCLCGGCGWCDAEVVEEPLHADAEGLVVTVDGGPVRGLAAAAGAADAGDDRRDDVVAEGKQGGDGAGCLSRDVIAARPAGFDSEVLPAELAQVVGALPDGVAGLP